jgi:ribose transport system permease protein
MEESNAKIDSRHVVGGLIRITQYREFILVIVIVIGAIIVTFINPAFMTVINLRAMALSFAPTGIIALAMAVVLISGGLDLSVGSIFALSGAVTALLFNRLGVDIWIAAVIGLIAGTAFGVLSGIMVGRIGLNPLVVTLATMIMARGMTLFLTEGRIVTLRGVESGFSFLGGGLLYGLPVVFVVFIILAIIFVFIFKKTVWMRNVFYCGSNEKAADYSGINVKRIKVSVYILSGLFASVAGIFAVSRFGVAVPTNGDGMEITAIAAVVIGGASLSGGEGSVMGAVLGVILMSFISNMLVLVGTSVYLQSLISGVILLVVVTVDHYNKKRLEEQALM